MDIVFVTMVIITKLLSPLREVRQKKQTYQMQTRSLHMQGPTFFSRACLTAYGCVKKHAMHSCSTAVSS